MLELYTYFRSSAAYRVRIALALKGLDWTPHAIHMLRDGGQQKSQAYIKVNPQRLVPTLRIEDNTVTQSIAICELLEELYPNPPLLPSNPYDRAYVRSIMAAVACEIHPLNNLRVLNHVEAELEAGKKGRLLWYRHWIADGFERLEGLLNQGENSGQYAFGNQPTLADVFIVPQAFNALRFDCPMDEFPRIAEIYKNCAQNVKFQAAAPDRQPDAE